MEHEKYGSAPIVFLDEEKRKKWEELPEGIKKSIKSHLHEITKRANTEMSIEILCNLYGDLSERLDKLEARKKLTPEQRFKDTYRDVMKE